MATELGFEVLPPLVFALTPGDYSAQCLSLKSSGANYAYLGNTAASNISVLKACKTAGVDVQFLGNVWGMDENAAKTAGDAADGVVFPLRTAVTWGGNAPGMKTVHGNLQNVRPDRQGLSAGALHRRRLQRALHSKEALDWAAKNGGATGENVAKGFYQKKDWVPAGMEGVCNRLDLDREGPSRHAEGRPLSHEGRGRDRRRSQRPDGQGHHQAREGQDRRTAAQAGMAGLVSVGVDNRALSRHPRESGDPVRRGLSIESQASLEYWVTRLRG